MSPEVTAQIVGPIMVGVVTYFFTKISAHKGATKVKEVVEQQFEEKIGQPNGLGSVVSMLEMTIREGRDRSQQLVEHMAQDTAQFNRLEQAIKEQHPSDQLDRMEQALRDARPGEDGTPK